MKDSPPFDNVMLSAAVMVVLSHALVAVVFSNSRSCLKMNDDNRDANLVFMRLLLRIPLCCIFKHSTMSK